MSANVLLVILTHMCHCHLSPTFRARGREDFICVEKPESIGIGLRSDINFYDMMGRAKTSNRRVWGKYDRMR